jgi:cell division cycle 20-like protein 1 (cofactor of APC complex)
VQVWDVAAGRRITVMQRHSARVSALAWNGDAISSGSLDKYILQHDARTPSSVAERRLAGHEQEVCRELVKYEQSGQHI